MGTPQPLMAEGSIRQALNSSKNWATDVTADQVFCRGVKFFDPNCEVVINAAIPTFMLLSEGLTQDVRFLE